MRAIFGLFLLLPVVLACSSVPARDGESATGCLKTQVLWVVNHGWHTGIIVNGDALRAQVPALASRFPGRTYLEVGWGDVGFYRADEVTVGLTLQALFWSSGSVMHVVGFDSDPAAYFYRSEVRSLALTPPAEQALLRFIGDSFLSAPGDALQAQGSGLYGDSEFYAANGRYHAFNTCNTWSATALKLAGMDIRPSLTLTASGVMSALPVTSGAETAPCSQAP